MSNERDELPEGWEWKPLGEACQVNVRDRRARELSDDLPVSFVPMAAVDAEQGAIATPQVRPLKEVRKGFTPFVDGDVIFAKITPCMENGKAAIARGLTNGLGFGSTEFHVLRPTDVVIPEWIFYFVRRQEFRNEAKENFSGTAGQLRVPDAFIRGAEIPVPPLDEQHRIVTKIEQLFAESRTAREALKGVPVLIKRFRQAVLAKAFRGELTERDPSDEPASVLPDSNVTQELPDEWRWAQIEEVCDRIVDCLHSTPKFKESGYMCIDTNCIKPGLVVFEKMRYVDEATFVERNRRMKPQEDDVMFSREGGLLGIAVRVPAGLEFCLGQRMMIFRVNQQAINAKYFEHWLNSQVFRSQYESKIGGTASPHLNIGDIRQLTAPLPSLDEQRRIVAKIEALFAQADAIEEAVNVARKRAEKVDQAILARAFRGEL